MTFIALAAFTASASGISQVMAACEDFVVAKDSEATADFVVARLAVDSRAGADSAAECRMVASTVDRLATGSMAARPAGDFMDSRVAAASTAVHLAVDSTVAAASMAEHLAVGPTVAAAFTAEHLAVGPTVAAAFTAAGTANKFSLQLPQGGPQKGPLFFPPVPFSSAKNL